MGKKYMYSCTEAFYKFLSLLIGLVKNSEERENISFQKFLEPKRFGFNQY